MSATDGDVPYPGQYVTLYVPAWREAREQLEEIGDPDARALLTSTMEQLEDGWEAFRDVLRWEGEHPRSEVEESVIESVRTFATFDIVELYRSVASDLARLVTGWPGEDLPLDNDAGARYTEFGRFSTLLLLAVDAGPELPSSLHAAVQPIARLLPGGTWYTRLANSFAALDDLSRSQITASVARRAAELLVDEVVDVDERLAATGSLVLAVESIYQSTGQPRPVWLDQLKAQFGDPIRNEVEGGDR